MLDVTVCFFINIMNNVLFYHGGYLFDWHVYVHGYAIWTTDLGFLKLVNYCLLCSRICSYFTGELKALQLIAIAVFGPVDWPLASCISLFGN